MWNTSGLAHLSTAVLIGGFQGHGTQPEKQTKTIISNTQRPSTIGTTELLYHRSGLMLRITKSIALLGYIASQLRGASAD